AVLGFQLILTIVVLWILNKFTAKYSFAQWLLLKGGLVRYLHPTNERLKETISNGNVDPHTTHKCDKPSKNQTSGKKSGSTRRRGTKSGSYQDDAQKVESFNVPRTLTLALDYEPLGKYYVMQLPFYSDLQWLLDFSFCTLIVYFTTEMYYTYFGQKEAVIEYNLALIWCFLAFGFALKILFSITATYFRGGNEAMGERSMCIVSGCFFFLISMVVLIPAEDILEFGLVEAHQTFVNNTRKLLEFQGVAEQSSGPVSQLIFRFWLAIACGLLGAILTFPGLRVSKMHKDTLTYSERNKFQSAIYNLSFISPLFIILFWIKPIARNYLTVREWPNRGVLMTPETFEATRLIFILVVLALRVSLFRKYIQSYLNIAPQRLSYLRKESGKITNLEIQKMIARVSYYLCVASLQFFGPILLCLFLTLLTKSTGNYRWTGSWLNQTNCSNDMCPVPDLNTLSSQSFLVNNEINETISNDEFINQTIIEDSLDLINAGNASNFTADLNATGEQVQTEQDIAKISLSLLKDVFNPLVFRGVIGFLLWWTVATWFSTQAIGFMYHSYFED
ncbi:hypothetical protein BLOT_001430, partial [Blomia tropicalis]